MSVWGRLDNIMGLTKHPTDDWIAEHRAIWKKKSGLRDYYETQIFNRILNELAEGPTLQLGAGAGFFSRYHPGMVNSDVEQNEGVDVVADVHDLQFEAETFANIVGVDVFHHFKCPKKALQECTRVLSNEGKLVLVEPWTGPVGWLFYKYIHHEDCALIEDPWTNAFPGEKKPLDGNAAIPKSIFYDHKDKLSQQVHGLKVEKIEYFGVISMILTGGFQSIGLPRSFVRLCYQLENIMPKPILKFFALRAMFVLQKTS